VHEVRKRQREERFDFGDGPVVTDRIGSFHGSLRA
jgi:hypothetical protein